MANNVSSIRPQRESFSRSFDNDYLLVKPTYSNGGLWLNYFSRLNSLCIRATGAITNHTSIEKYCLRFFLREISAVHADHTQLNQYVMFFMNAEDITTIGIQIEYP